MSKQSTKKEEKEQKEQKTESKDLTPVSERFLNQVQTQFASEMGKAVKFTDYQKTLAQHLFLKIDQSLKGFEAKRDDKNKASFTWNNINLQKLALDAVHTVNLGLDALQSNHIHPIPYWNKSLGKYDLDIRIGYKGKDYLIKTLALDPPENTRYELVYSTDIFVPLKKSANREFESYEFDIKEPFNRGNVIGGFGYIEYKDSTKNKLILVSPKDFERAKSAAKTKDFWTSDEEAMQYKTIVNRVAGHIQLDPEKVNKSLEYMEAQEIEAIEAKMDNEISSKANKQPIEIDGDEQSEEEFEWGNEDKKQDGNLFHE